MRRLCLFAILCSSIYPVTATEPSVPTENPFRDDPPPAKPAQVAPADPTVPGPMLKDALQPPRGIASNSSAKLPTIQLRGRVISADGTGRALLLVNGRLERVVVDSEISEADGTVIKVLAVSQTEVRVKLSPFERVLSLR